SEDRPEGHRLEIDPLGSKRAGGAPDFGEPAQLLVARTTVMDLGDRHRDPVAVPRLAQPRPDAGVGVKASHPYRLGVDIGVAAIPAGLAIGIMAKPVVEKSLAGKVVIDS